VDLAVTNMHFAGKLNIFNARNPGEVAATDGSENLFLASIPVGDQNGTPRYSAATNDASRLYVPLEDASQVSVVDLTAFKELDINPETTNVNPINLPSGSRPRAIAIGSDDRYAYVSDRNSQLIYVIDIDPYSEQYNQYVGNINLNGVSGVIKRMSVNQDATRLFVTVSEYAGTNDGHIVAINIDPEDTDDVTRKWHQQIGKIAVGNGAEGVSTTPEALKMVFTDRREEFKGYGVLTVTNNDPLSFEMSASYASLGLGSAGDYFDVNEGVDLAVMYDEATDTNYAFVAGRNSRLWGSGIPSIDGDLAGSNVGIIKDALSDNPKLVAATRPIPDGITNSLALSGDNRYLYATYPLARSTFVFDVREMIDTLGSPSLDSVPIDDINPKIDVAAGLQPIELDTFRREYEFGVPDGVEPPLATEDGFPYSVSNASDFDGLTLLPVDDDNNIATGRSTKDLTPTLRWKFEKQIRNGEGDNCECEVNEVLQEEIEYVNLYVSVFDENNGLRPDVNSWVKPEPEDNEDKNPNRVLTAKWENGVWSVFGQNNQVIASIPGDYNSFSLDNNQIKDKILTAGQEYHWYVEVKSENEIAQGKPSEFNIALQDPIQEPNTFSSITILTGGIEEA
ncbi:MAG: beta-propeller fold lactonase family protein, partial [Cyanobacteria bacterium J06638_38]